MIFRLLGACPCRLGAYLGACQKLSKSLVAVGIAAAVTVRGRLFGRLCFILLSAFSLCFGAFGSSCSAAGDPPKLLRVALIGAGACRVLFLPELLQLLTLLASVRLSLFTVARLSALRVHSPQTLPELLQDLTTLAALFPLVVILSARIRCRWPPAPGAHSSGRSFSAGCLFSPGLAIRPFLSRQIVPFNFKFSKKACSSQTLQAFPHLYSTFIYLKVLTDF